MVLKPVVIFLSLVFLSGCSSLPLAREYDCCRLVIRNPESLALKLERVGLDIPPIALGNSDAKVEKLQSGRYILRAGGTSYAVPLLAEVIGDDGEIVIDVASVPPAPEGFVFVPGGPGLVGDVLGVGSVHERPARVMSFDPVLVAVKETTNREYCAFLNAVRRCEEEWLDLGGPKCHIAQADSGAFTSTAPDLPVVTVSFAGAEAYCRWKSESTGRHHRLPTEWEWERVARGPATTTYAYGNVYTPAAANQESGKLMRTAAFPPTGWGTFDMTGNAFEWTSSLYAPGLHVLKGGSFVLDGSYLRNSLRMWYRPRVQADDIGFRVVQELDQ